jgi:hypothetical protein
MLYLVLNNLERPEKQQGQESPQMNKKGLSIFCHERLAQRNIDIVKYARIY